METILNVKNLNVYYKNKETLINRFRGKSENRLQHVLKNVSFHMEKGEVLGLVGESGCGKTSLAKAILGMQKQYNGTITLDCPNPQMVFQDPYSSLNPSKKIGWILEEPLRMKARKEKKTEEFSKIERVKKVDQMLARVGLEEKLKEHYPTELSGGQRQRIAIAAALLFRLLPWPSMVEGVFVLMIAMPVGTTAVMLAADSGADAIECTKGCIITTLLSVITIPIVSAFLTF